MSVILKQVEIGPMQNFQYFIGCSETHHVAVVDPAWDVDELLTHAKNNDYHIIMALLTHGHPDHVEGADRIANKLDIPIRISADEAPCYMPECKNLIKLHNHDRIPIGNIEIECLSTPGHSSGCMCFKCGDILLTGDTLFVNACGRCDLPSSNPEAMYHSLYDVILKLPDSIQIYPGHRYGPWPSSTLAKQRVNNPYLTCKSKEEFLTTRMGY